MKTTVLIKCDLSNGLKNKQNDDKKNYLEGHVLRYKG